MPDRRVLLSNNGRKRDPRPQNQGRGPNTWMRAFQNMNPTNRTQIVIDRPRERSAVPAARTDCSRDDFEETQLQFKLQSNPAPSIEQNFLKRN